MTNVVSPIAIKNQFKRNFSSMLDYQDVNRVFPSALAENMSPISEFALPEPQIQSNTDLICDGDDGVFNDPYPSPASPVSISSENQQRNWRYYSNLFDSISYVKDQIDRLTKNQQLFSEELRTRLACIESSLNVKPSIGESPSEDAELGINSFPFGVL